MRDPRRRGKNQPWVLCGEFCEDACSAMRASIRRSASTRASAQSRSIVVVPAGSFACGSSHRRTCAPDPAARRRRRRPRPVQGWPRPGAGRDCEHRHAALDADGRTAYQAADRDGRTAHRAADRDRESRNQARPRRPEAVTERTAANATRLGRIAPRSTRRSGANVRSARLKQPIGTRRLGTRPFG